MEKGNNVMQPGQLYPGDTQRQTARYAALREAFAAAFGRSEGIRFFSAPGRSEIGGNHTDHQHGCVLACAVTLDLAAAVTARDDQQICICSEGYDPIRLDANQTEPNPQEKNTSVALVRGILAGLRQRGWRTGGFDACVESDVPKGSGLSSSAAYSILIASIISGLYNDGTISPLDQALASKLAENVYFGKPSGLMDQLACATGGFAAIDFADPEQPVVERIDCDLERMGYAICIVNPGGSHANLTPEYAAIPEEMYAVAHALGKQVLREVPEEQFYAEIASLRQKTGDRAVLRAMHYFAENIRAQQQAAALKQGDMEQFRQLMRQSGSSSFEQLQNVCPADAGERSLALALALSERMIGESGAWRVHGGGFAGTMQALVPLDRAQAYTEMMERVFGEGCCYRLRVRPIGGCEVKLS